MSLPSEQNALRAGRMLIARRLVLMFVVLASWIVATLRLGSQGEAFWMLFPIWVLIGAYGLKAIPKPRSPYKKAWLKWIVMVILIILPVGFCYGMAHYMMAKVRISEVLTAVWFFAASLELLLLYLFQIYKCLHEKLSKGKTRAQSMAIYAGGKVVLYTLLVALLLPTMAIHRVKFVPNDPPKELELTYEEVTFLSRSDPGHPRMELKGWFFPLRGNKGTVLACHGTGANRADISLMIMLLLEAGYQVLSFDFRGHGESEGHSLTYGYHERNDVLGAWDYLRSREDVHPDRIYGFGVSMGAASLLLALPEMPEINAVFVDSAYSSLELMLYHQYRFLPQSLAHVPAAVSRWVGWLDSGLKVREVNPAETIRDLQVPIYFTHGLEDATIPPECATILYESYQGPKHLKLVPGADHCEAAALGPDYYRNEIETFFLGVGAQ